MELDDVGCVPGEGEGPGLFGSVWFWWGGFGCLGLWVAAGIAAVLA